jgi:hypothetical protein
MAETLKISKGVFFRKNAEKIMCINSQDEDFVVYEFDLDHEILIDLLKEGTREEELIVALQEEFEIDQEVAKKDIGQFVKELKEVKIVES